MAGLVTILIIITCILLILVVLVQNSKGGGIASNFASSNQVMGVQKTSELIEKVTWGLAIALVVLSISASFLYKSSGVTIKDTELRNKIDNAKTQKPVQNMPTQNAPAPAPATK
jgi:preprotein translocase subunit SecG